jgi:uncharacterized protein (TIGR00730 family)
MDKEICKAYENLDFLHSHEARPIRVLCELIEPGKKLQDQKVENTIVFFGSARSKSFKEAEGTLSDLKAKYPEESKQTEGQKALLQKAESLALLSKYYDQAEELAKRLSQWSYENFPEDKRLHVCSGGGPGMMEAANKGAREAGSKSIALGISLPFEQGVNQFATPELSFEFHYFFIRKFYFLYHAKTVIVFPGGFGTMDELFEVLTLIQTKKVSKDIKIYLYGKDFWEGLINFDHFVKWGVISPEDLHLFQIVDDVGTAYDLITSDLQAKVNDH